MKALFALTLLCLPTLSAAAGLGVSIEVPRIDVASYHNPYVAAWIEREDNSAAAQLAVWYQVERGEARKPGDGKPAQGGGESGTKWLPDLRQWWRRGGRSTAVPIDGVTGATRPPGQHELRVDAADKRLAALPPGNYRLVVEAAREDGGRELLKLPFAWPVAADGTQQARGSSELGVVTLTLSK
jgi:hypothetical protein